MAVDTMINVPRGSGEPANPLVVLVRCADGVVRAIDRNRLAQIICEQRARLAARRHPASPEDHCAGDRRST